MKKGIGLGLIIAALLFVLSNLNSKKNEEIEKLKLEIVEPKYEYGIRIDTFNIIKCYKYLHQMPVMAIR